MTKITRDDVTIVLMALDTEVRAIQQRISNDLLDGDYKVAAIRTKNMKAILDGMAEFDRMAPKYPDIDDSPEDNMPVMAALYIKSFWDNRQKIPGIKAIREPFGLNLKEAKALLDAVEDGYPVFVGYVGEETGNKVAQELFDWGWDAWCLIDNREVKTVGLDKAISLEDIKAKRVPSRLY